MKLGMNFNVFQKPVVSQQAQKSISFGSVPAAELAAPMAAPDVDVFIPTQPRNGEVIRQAQQQQAPQIFQQAENKAPSTDIPGSLLNTQESKPEITATGEKQSYCPPGAHEHQGQCYQCPPEQPVFNINPYTQQPECLPNQPQTVPPQQPAPQLQPQQGNPDANYAMVDPNGQAYLTPQDLQENLQPNGCFEGYRVDPSNAYNCIPAYGGGHLGEIRNGIDMLLFGPNPTPEALVEALSLGFINGPEVPDRRPGHSRYLQGDIENCINNGVCDPRRVNGQNNPRHFQHPNYRPACTEARREAGLCQ